MNTMKSSLLEKPSLVLSRKVLPKYLSHSFQRSLITNNFGNESLNN